MKTLFKLLMWAAFIFAASAGYSQCSAQFGIYGNGPGGITVLDTSYINSFYDSTSTAKFIWTFGDGTTDTTISQPSTNHEYTTSGIFTICLDVIDTANSCTGQQCTNDTINLCANAVQFVSNVIGFGEDSFDANYSGNYTATWNYGDGNTGNGLSTSHQYTANGNYNVCVKVSGAGCADSVCQQVNVNVCQPFNLRATITPVSYNPYTASFAVNNPNASYTYSWKFTDGSLASGSNITHSFYHDGGDSVVLMVSNGGSCSDSAIQVFLVNRCGISPAANENSNGPVANFSLSSGIIDSNQVSGTSNLWVFPGGTPASSTAANVTVTYTALGTYVDTVFISTQSGCVDTIAQSFALTPGSYSISGNISAGTDTGLVMVYLVIQDSTGHLALYDSTITNFWSDSGLVHGGYYAFYNVPTDSYYVKAALDPSNINYANYLPTYYTSSLSWTGATPVYVNPNSATGINIALTPGTNPGGPGFVGGYVSQGAGLVLQQGGNNLTRGVGDALSGVQINLLTQNDEAVAYTFTDVNGQYHFSHLAYGSYYIYAEELNKEPVHIPFTLSASDSDINNLNLSINSDSSYATAINNVNQISIAGIYPNPVVNKLEVQLSSAQMEDATVKLVDMLGQTTVASNSKLAVGANRLELDMTNLASGVYNLIIQTNGQHLTYKVVKAK